jgi:beta-glucosidase
LLVQTLSNEEKNNITLGQATGLLDLLTPSNGCTGTSGGMPRVRYPGLCLQDGPAGVRNADLVSAFPSGIHLGASWNKELVREISLYMGMEFKKKGVNVALGPSVGPLGRIALGGRNWEGFGADPYLAGRMGAVVVQGLQKSVIACVKHFIGNEQETDRNSDLFGISKAVSSNIDARTMHEVYLWPFQDTIRAGAGSVMCAYNRVNGIYACENNGTLNTLLKQELGFKGFVVSDWNSQHADVLSASSGLDMIMPDASSWKNSALIKAVQEGALPQERLDDMATRILATWYKQKMDDSSWPALGVGLAASLTKPHTLVDARDPASKRTILQAAVEGHVLLKNTGNILPLRSPKLLSLFGFDASAPLTNNPTDLAVSRWALGANSLASSDASLLAAFATGSGSLAQAATKGTLITGGGSGTTTGPYISAPLHAFENQAYEDGTYLHWDFSSTNPNVNPTSEACIVFINEFAIEALDRTGLADTEADKLVLNVAQKCKNTIVVIHNAGIRLVDKWIDHPNVKAALFAHLPGQDSGRALVEVMYGKQSPSGRLPYTLAKKESDYGKLLKPAVKQKGKDGTPQASFDEGVDIDYRAFLKAGIQPRFPFGYGLSYTTFTYSELTITATAAGTVTELPPPSPIESGGNSALFEQIAFVTCKITNVGKFAAAEVAQLYILAPNEQTRKLRGFEKKMLGENFAETFTFPLTRRDLSIWDTAAKQWRLQKGEYNIYVGGNVLDAKLEGVLRM